MKSNAWKSFRYKIVLYAVLSLLLSIVTMASVLGVAYAVYRSMGGEFETIETTEEKSFMLNVYPQTNQLQSTGGYQVGKEDSRVYLFPRVERTTLIIWMICFMIIGVCLFILYFLKFMKPFSNYLEIMEEGIEEITLGNFQHTIEIKSYDEFGVIANKLNSMAKSLNKIISENQTCENKKHELITSVAHDLRTPLTSVLGYLELLRSNKVNEDVKQHYIDVVYHKSKRLEQLIEDLFSYTKYTYGNVASITEEVDVIKLVEQLLDEFYPSFEDNCIEVEFYKDCNQLISYADGNLLARAFANLIGNAIKYGAEGKRIEIHFSHKLTEYKLQVKNYGKIIPEQDIPHIFERFYRVEDSRSVETGGSGLGLAIAKSIVTMHHGEIVAKSDLNGTVFEVVLPILFEPEEG